MRQRLNREAPPSIDCCSSSGRIGLHRATSTDPSPLLLLLLLAKAETNRVLPITYAEHNLVEQELSL